MSDNGQPRKRAAKKAAKKVSKKAARKKAAVPAMADVDVEEAADQVLPEAEPVVMDDTAFEAEEKEREEAYYDEPEWNGVVLQPFSVSRESFFDQHRVAVGAPSISKILESSSYAFVADAIRILYLCSHHPKEWRSLRSQPELLQERMEEWADENIKPGQELDAVTVALKIFNGSQVNQAESIPSGEPGAEDELGN